MPRPISNDTQVAFCFATVFFSARQHYA